MNLVFPSEGIFFVSGLHA